MDKHLDKAPCIFMAFTNDGLLMDVNQTLCTIIGIDKKDLIKKNLSTIVTLATRIFFQTHFFPLLRLEGHAEEVFVTLLCADGTEVPVILNTKKDNDDKDLFIGVGITIQNRNKYEESIIAAKRYAENALMENKELQQAKAQLQQHTLELDAQLVVLQQQNGNLQQINWTLTHTLQEPLRKISLYSSKLIQANSDSKAGELLQKLNGLAIRTRQILTHLQQYVQMGLLAQDQRPIKLQSAVAKTAEQFILKGHQIIINLQQLPEFLCFPAEVDLLVYHLLLNAVQFAKEGKLAEIIVDGTIVQANTLRSIKGKYQYENYLRLSVKDAGIGFNTHYKEQIFSLFTKLDSGTAGFGMGLAICKKIMDLHKGFIIANADDGEGATIDCFFPLIESSHVDNSSENSHLAKAQ